MQSGKLRHQVILERRTDVQQPGGQVKHDYVPFATDVWAAIEPVSGREFFAAQQVQAEVTTRIRIRWRDDVDETCRIRHVTRHTIPIHEDIYDIAAVLPDAKTGRRELVLMCTKRTAEGWRG